MEDKIKKMYIIDCLSIIFLAVILWMILSVAMLNISRILENQTLRMIILAIGTLVGALSTASCAAVIIHLKKNQKNLY